MGKIPSTTDTFYMHAQVNLGALEIALAISLILFGVFLHQVREYYKTFKDRALLRVLVASVSLLEISHTITIIHTIYYPTVTLYGDSRIEPNSYSLTTSVVFETMITALVQGFFAYRIYRLSEMLHVSIVCWTLSLLRFGGGLALAAESYLSVPSQAIDTFALTNNFGWLITLAVTVGAAVDILIAISLCYFIKQLAPMTSSKRMTALINRLMVWTIQTGLVTSIASVAVVITFHTVRNTLLWFSLYMVLAKLYSNSFFMTLNVRHRREAEYISGSFDGLGGGTKKDVLPTSHSVKLGRLSNDSYSSYGSPYKVPMLHLPVQMLGNKNSFQHAICIDLAERGLAV